MASLIPESYWGQSPLSAISEFLKNETQNRALRKLGIPQGAQNLPPQLLTQVLKGLQEKEAMEQWINRQQQGAIQLPPPEAQIGSESQLPETQIGQSPEQGGISDIIREALAASGMSPQGGTFGQQQQPLQQEVQPQGMQQRSEMDKLSEIMSAPRSIRPFLMEGMKGDKKALALARQDINKTINAPKDGIANKISANEEKIANLKKFKNAIKDPKTIAGPTKALIDKFGLENIFTNPATQFSDKISADLLMKELGSMKGLSRATDFIIRSLSKALPNTLLYKDSANLISDLQILNSRIQNEKYKSGINLAKSYLNKGIEPPVDWQLQGNQAASPNIAKLERDFQKKISSFLFKETLKNDPVFRDRVNKGIYKDGKVLTLEDGSKVKLVNKMLVPIQEEE